MKVNGVEATPMEDHVLAFPRAAGDIVFVLRGIEDYDEFMAMCPEPTAGGFYSRAAGGWTEDRENPNFLKEMAAWRQKRLLWVYLKTLEPSNIEWDRVKIDDPKTWVNMDAELEAILLPTERGKLVTRIEIANSLNQAKLDAARAAFFLRQQAALVASRLQDEVSSLANSQPASGSESSLQESTNTAGQAGTA